MAEESKFCSEHSLCLEKFSQLQKENVNLREDINKLKDEVSDIKIQRVKDTEQINMLYHIVGEIKDSIKDMATGMKSLNDKMDSGFKEMNEKMDKQSDRQNKRINDIENQQIEKDSKSPEDSFKEFLVKFGQELLKLALSGGIIYAILNGLRP